MKIDVRIRTYEMNGDGDLEPLDDGPFEAYGACPNVGDTVCIERANGRQAFSVVRRYYLNSRGWGWAVIVRQIELAPQIVRVMDAWEEDVRFWGEIDREAERKEEARRAATASHLLPPAKQQTKRAAPNPKKHTAPKPKPR